MQRGDIFELRPHQMVPEQQGRRLGVVVQADALLARSLVLVAPTSQSVRRASFRPELVVEGHITRVLVELVGTVNVNGLGRLVGHASPEETWDIDESLLAVLGLGSSSLRQGNISGTPVRSGT